MFELGNVGNYLKSGFGLLGNEVSKGAAGPVGEVSSWNKAKGALASTMDRGEKDIGKLFGDVDFDDPANDEALGMIADVEEETYQANKKEEKPMDFAKMAKVLQSIKPAEGPKVSVASRGGGGGFNFNSKLYENPLLTREYQGLYMEPLYKNLI